MRKTILLSSVLLFALTVATAAAQEPGAQAPEAQTQGLAAKTEDVMGTISKVDTIANSLTIKKSDNQEQSYKMDAAAKITVDGKTSTLADLKQGQKATLKVEADKVLSVSANSASTS